MEPENLVNCLKHFRRRFATVFLRHCVLSGGTQRSALPHFLSEKIETKLNILFPQVRMEPTTSQFAPRLANQ